MKEKYFGPVRFFSRIETGGFREHKGEIVRYDTLKSLDPIFKDSYFDTPIIIGDDGNEYNGRWYWWLRLDD